MSQNLLCRRVGEQQLYVEMCRATNQAVEDDAVHSEMLRHNHALPALRTIVISAPGQDVELKPTGPDPVQTPVFPRSALS